MSATATPWPAPEKPAGPLALSPFGLGATRLAVDTKAEVTELANDCHALLSSAMSALDAMTDEASAGSTAPEIRDPWWAMLYTMRHAQAVFAVLYDRVHEFRESRT